MTARIYRALGILVFLMATAAADWHGWGGPSGNFTVSDAGILQPGEDYSLKTVWKKPLGTGYSAVSVAGDRVVTLFSDGTSDFVVTLDAGDGTERWRHRIGPFFPGNFGSLNGPISTPLLIGGKVISLSPRGRLFALDIADGQPLWETDLVADHKAVKPFYGFATSPLKSGDLVIVQTGGTEGNAVSAFDPDNGQVVWTAGADTVAYQSPGLFNIGGSELLVAIANKHVYGLRPGNGEVVWTFAGDDAGAPMGSESAMLIETGPGHFFWKKRSDGGVLIGVGADGEDYNVEELWDTQHIKGTYVLPVYHDDHLYGYNSRIFTCIDARTGERVWRSRQPGDGFPIVLDGHLVVATKDGHLSLAPASSEGYDEMARLQLFDQVVWAPPTFANGRLYLRSMREIACVEIVPQAIIAAAAAVEGKVPGSRLARFAETVEAAADRRALVDSFMAAQTSFPVIEGDSLVHFIYRGEAQEMALTGDLVGWRFDRPLHRVEGTDLFYYSAALEPGARLTYRFNKDMQDAQPDSLNPRGIQSMMFGAASWFGMPAWQEPTYLQARQDGLQGHIDSLGFQSQWVDSSHVIEVYLPPDYDPEGGPYPVAYIHGGALARNLGQVHVAVDNLIGKRVEPLITVFMPSFFDGGYAEYLGEKRDVTARILVEEIVPLIDSTYRTVAEAEGRANMGNGLAAVMAFYSSFKHPGVFGKLALQSMWWDKKEASEKQDMVVAAGPASPHIYLDWGKYDLRSPLEGLDVAAGSRTFAGLLQQQGYTLTGGEVEDGFGWGSWKTRTDRIFETFFPLASSN